MQNVSAQLLSQLCSCVPLIYSFIRNNLFRFVKFNGLSFNFIVMHIGRTPVQELMVFRLDFQPRVRDRKIIKNGNGQKRAYAFVFELTSHSFLHSIVTISAAFLWSTWCIKFCAMGICGSSPFNRISSYFPVKITNSNAQWNGL